MLFHTSKYKSVKYVSLQAGCTVHDNSELSDSGNGKLSGRTAACRSGEGGVSTVALPVPYGVLDGDLYYCLESALFKHRPYLSKADEVSSMTFLMLTNARELS